DGGGDDGDGLPLGDQEPHGVDDLELAAHGGFDAGAGVEDRGGEQPGVHGDRGLLAVGGEGGLIGLLDDVAQATLLIGGDQGEGADPVGGDVGAGHHRRAVEADQGGPGSGGERGEGLARV